MKIKDIQEREDLALINGGYEVNQVFKSLPYKYTVEKYGRLNGLFVKVGEGEYTEVYGFEGIIPYLEKGLYLVYLKPIGEYHLAITLNTEIETDKDIQKYMWKKYHIDIDIDSESDNYTEMFYNQDLRSLMGFVWEFDNPLTVVIWPEYYAQPENTFWGEFWRELIYNSELTTL